MSPEPVEIRPAVVADLDAIRNLLDNAGLPTADLDGSAVTRFLVAVRQGRVIGAVACEPAGARCGLLRSVVVAPEFRGQGLGERLVAEIEAASRRQGLRALYLLTTTAQEFFSHLGYVVTDRRQVPAEIRATREFASLCPATAVCMLRVLGRN